MLVEIPGVLVWREGSSPTFTMICIFRKAILPINRNYSGWGSSTWNRGQAARSISNSHRGFLPLHLGNSAGGTGKANSSSIVQR